MCNPYDNNVLGEIEFLNLTYTLMKKKVKRLIQIEDSRLRGKLSLPLIKEKFEETSKLLQSILHLQHDIKYTRKEDEELADILNYIGIEVSKGNIEKGTDATYHYLNAIKVLDGFLNIP